MDPRTDKRNTEHHTKNAYAMASKTALIKYLHQAAFIPQKITIIKAIYKKFSSWPGSTSRAVQKYPPYSALETDKGHTKIQKPIGMT